MKDFVKDNWLSCVHIEIILLLDVPVQKAKDMPIFVPQHAVRVNCKY